MRDRAVSDRPAWIEVLGEESWTGLLAELHPRVVDPATGRVDHIMAVHSLDPEGLAAHDAVYRAAMRSTRTLRKVDRELIAFVVSDLNDCGY